MVYLFEKIDNKIPLEKPEVKRKQGYNIIPDPSSRPQVKFVTSVENIGFPTQMGVEFQIHKHMTIK